LCARTLFISWGSTRGSCAQSQQLLFVLLDKLIEFMYNEFPGIQDMSCTTFLKVSQACKEKIIETDKKGSNGTRPLTQGSALR
jgi:hypothetical protein